MKNILSIELCDNGIEILKNHKRRENTNVVYLIDRFFKNKLSTNKMDLKKTDFIHYVDSTNELTTTYVNYILSEIIQMGIAFETVIGIGGGTTLDCAKAISNLLNNEGKAEDYQGWDLVQNPGVYKIGIPTLSGTGAEASRTCVMINPKNGLKLGMNSNHTIYDELILDYSLSSTVPRNQFFYTGLDTYVHCIESLNGKYRHALSDAYSAQALNLSKSVFLSADMMSDSNREKMMVASYFGGVAIGNSYVGLIHPLSAGLSVVLGIHHGEANCITMNAMESFYPKEYGEFMEMVDTNKITLQKGICSNLTDQQYEELYNSSIMHEVPLKNALGPDFKKILTKEKVIELYKMM